MLGWRIGKDVGKPYIEAHESVFITYTGTNHILVRATTEPLIEGSLNVMPSGPEELGLPGLQYRAIASEAHPNRSR
jgi:hypothetical protein